MEESATLDGGASEEGLVEDGATEQASQWEHEDHAEPHPAPGTDRDDVLSPAAELGLDAGTHSGTARGPAMEPVGPLETNLGSTEAIAVDVDVPASSSTVVSSPEMLPVGRPPTPPRARRKRRRRPSSSSSELRPDDEGGRYDDLENYNRREDESTLDYHRRCLAQAIAYAAARGMHKKSDFECFVPLICMLPHYLAGMCMLACLLYATKCKPRPWWIVVRPLPGHFVRRNLSTGRSWCRQSMKKYYSKPRAPPGPSQKEGQQVTRRPGSVLPTDVCYHTVHHVRASWGPKSPGRPYIALLLILLCILPSYGEGMYVATEPRVATEAAAVAGAQNQVLQRASHINAKLSGAHDTNQLPNFSRARKRAFRRAIGRAEQHGSTQYRGRILTLQQLNLQRRGTEPGARNPRPTAVRQTASASGPQLLSWNVGGLTTAILDELMLWLDQPANSGIAFVLLQETRWTYTAEWCTGKWSIVHSGCKSHKGGGVMILVAREVCGPSEIRFHEVLKGRVLHARLPFGTQGRHLDLINVYQHPWDFCAPQEALVERRRRVLDAVTATLHGIPRRNLCVCGGDWNTQLLPHPGLVGDCTTLPKGGTQVAADAAALNDFMRLNQLVALNTWTGRRREAYTYEHNGRRTQIDYVIARRQDASPHHRRFQPVKDFPITAWRLSGLHRPVLGALTVPTGPAQHKKCGAAPATCDVNRLRQEAACNSETYRVFQQVLNVRLALLPRLDMDAINQTLQHVSLSFFPPKSKQVAIPARETAIVREVVQTRWQHYHAAKAAKIATARNVLRGWFHVSRFRTLRKAANRASRDARRQQYEVLLQQAEACAASHDQRGLYQVVRALAPKQSYKKVQIYGPNGQMLNMEEEARTLHDHFVTSFSREELCAAFARIPSWKATPKHMAPGMVWKAACEGLADVVGRELPNMWQGTHPWVPQSWRDGWLKLLGKPAKPGRRPEDFRPICLQDPVGKEVLRLLAARVKPAIVAYAEACPQHAYLPGRSTQGALLWIFGRCRQIRDKAQAARYDIYSKRAGCSVKAYSGGFVLSLDLTSAFDLVPRDAIQASLREAGLQPEDVALIMHWLCESTYHLEHGHIRFSLATDRGVRQGCVLSPLLWTCFTCYVLRRMPAEVPVQDQQVYADDFVMSKTFDTRAGFLAALQSISVYFRTLRSFGLRIKLGKTALLIRMAHQTGQALLKKHITSNHKGDFLVLPGPTPEYVPVKQEHSYLGCVISLYDFEGLTAKRRLDVAKSNFSRLRRVLTSTRCLKLARRVRVWSTCVWTSLTYGINCCGLTERWLIKFARLATQQLRTISRMPRHITHVSNRDLYASLKVGDPYEVLTKQHHTFLASFANRQAALSSEDIMQSSLITEQLSFVAKLFASVTQRSSIRRLEDTPGVACPVCGVYFADTASMRVHWASAHQDVQRAEPLDVSAIRREDISVNGMPVCRGCGRKFAKRQNLLQHVQNRRCEGFSGLVKQADAKPEVVPAIKNKEIIGALLRGGARQFERDLKAQDAARKQWLEHCCICRQWVANPKHIKQHIRKSHNALLTKWEAQLSEDCLQLVSTLAGQQTCPYCAAAFSKATYLKRHVVNCPVLFQAALVCRAHGDGDRDGDRLSLRGSTASSQKAGGGEATAGPQRRDQGGACAAPEVAKVQRQRKQREGQRQGAERREQSPGIQSGRDAHTGADHGGHQASHTVGLTPRRQHQHLTPGSSFPAADEDLRPGEHGECTVWNLPAVEAASRGGEDGGAAPHCSAKVSHLGIEDESSADHRVQGESSDSGQNGMAAVVQGSRALLAPPGLGLGQSSGQAGSGPRPATALRCDESPGHRHERSGWHDHPTISFDATAGSGPAGSNDGVPHGGFQQGRRGAGGVQRDQHPVPLRTLLCHRGENPRGHGEAHTLGQSRARDLEHVLALRLYNTNNVCYQNSLILALLWSLLSCDVSQAAGGLCFGVEGSHADLICSLLALTNGHLQDLPSWRRLLQGWRQPFRQHDVCEFAGHILRQLKLHHMEGFWLARRADPDVRMVDFGELWQPIPLHIPPEAQNLQDCLQHWHSQSTIQALDRGVSLVLFQLVRFRRDAEGVIRKNCQALDMLPHALLPVHGEGLDITWHAYHLSACIFHVGLTPDSGHYRAFLMGHAASGVRGSTEDLGTCEVEGDDGVTTHQYVTDDNQQAIRATPALHRDLEQNSYLLFYTRSAA